MILNIFQKPSNILLLPTLFSKICMSYYYWCLKCIPSYDIKIILCSFYLSFFAEQRFKKSLNDIVCVFKVSPLKIFVCVLVSNKCQYQARVLTSQIVWALVHAQGLSFTTVLPFSKLYCMFSISYHILCSVLCEFKLNSQMFS